MDFTGSTDQGLHLCGPDGVKTTVQLRKWLRRGQTFVASLPPKKLGEICRVIRTIPQLARRTSS